MSTSPIHNFDAVWDIRDGRTYFSGPLYHCANHQHGAPVFLAGLYGKFRLRLAGGDWQWCRTAIIPAGVVHELEVGGEPITVLYIEPTVAGVDAFRPLVRAGGGSHGGWTGQGGEIGFMRELYEARYRPDWSTAELAELLAYACGKARPAAIDPRLMPFIAHLDAHGDDLTPVAAWAAQAGLSASRFQHLFTAQIGVPFRRYRAWNRMRHAIAGIVCGHDFTTAAHAAGFCDSAHFGHQFRQTFGAPASISLHHLARLQR